MYSESESHPFPPLESATTNSEKPGPKRILIVTPDILGPISNGGIGTAYYYAANELARMGHQVSILYTLNRLSEKNDIAHWVLDYKSRGITLIPCPDPDIVVSPGILGQTARLPYHTYEWLKNHEEEFDIVHGSEWSANLYYCLLAKLLGQRFQHIHFVIKASSPLLWNRIGNNEPIHQYSDLLRIFMERKSIEWADYAISGSHYMLNWMGQNGYELPHDRCFVQPNIFPLIPTEESRQDPLGKATELVFFGRLERRKGLHIFLDALRRLVYGHDQGELKLEGINVTFLGKSRKGYDAKKEISSVIENSVLEYRIIDNMGQPEAIRYLKEGSEKLVIMPSVIDNSPFGVYELLGYKIPFITSSAGGGKELIHKDDWDKVLFAPHPHSIHMKLLEVINQPLYMPRPSLDFGKSLKEWDEWHRRLPALTGTTPGSLENSEKDIPPLVSICLAHFNRPIELGQALNSINELNYSNIEVIIVDDGSTLPEAIAYLEEIKTQKRSYPVEIYRQPNLYLGASRNLAAAHANGEYILFMDDDNLAKPDELDKLVSALEFAHADIITCFADTFTSASIPETDSASRSRIVFTGADLTSGMFRNPYGDSNCLIRRKAFEKIGGFTEDYKIGRDDQEFFSRALLSGLKLYVLPEATYWYRISESRMRQNQFSLYAGVQRVGKPFIEIPEIPIEYANILRYAQGLAAVRLGLAATIVSRISQSTRLRRLVQRFPILYRVLNRLHRAIS